MPTVSVSLNGQSKDRDIDEDETIYDGLERQGITLPHGCLSGSCGSCKIEITNGSSNLSAASAIEANTLASIAENLGPQKMAGKIIRLSCRAKIKGDVSVRPLKLDPVEP
jgi:ferredoxin